MVLNKNQINENNALTNHQSISDLSELINLKGKTAIITGSSLGIGKKAAEVLALHGANVIINGRNIENCETTAAEIILKGGNAFSCPGDITKKADVDNIINETLKQYGSIDILVNNAGSSWDGLFHKMDDNQFNQIVDACIKGTHLITQAVIPHFLKEGREYEFKKIINISSVAGITGSFGQSNYITGKSGMMAYSKAISREFARDRVNVNVIAPGFIETRMTNEKHKGDRLGIPKSIRDSMIENIPFSKDGIAGKSDHVAHTILFLSSRMSDWITGQVIVVDGGAFI